MKNRVPMKLWSVLLGLLVVACAPTDKTSDSQPSQLIPPKAEQPASRPANIETKPRHPFAVTQPSTEVMNKVLEAIEHTNALRQAQGLHPLRYDARLTAYAMVRAGEIVTKFGHERPSGEMYRAHMSIGRLVGENIAAGKSSPRDTVIQWQNSPRHYHTLTQSDFTKIGIGYVHAPDTTYKHYWVQIFGADNTDTTYHFDE